MTIHPSGPSRPRLDGSVPARSPQSVTRTTDEPVGRPTAAPAVGGRDVLDISPAARALAARGDGEDTLSAERLMELRQRVLDGSYDSPAVIDAIAHGLRRRGDLR